MKNIKKVVLVVGIVMLVASIGAVVVFAENPSWDRDAEDRVDSEGITESRNPRQEVDPDEVKPLISQSEAFNIAEEMGYELTSEARVRLIEDLRAGTVYWEIIGGEADNPYIFKIGANDGRIVHLSPSIKVSENWEYIVTSENAVDIAREAVRNITRIEVPEQIERTAPIVERREIYFLGETYSETYSVKWIQELNGIPVVGSHITIHLLPSGGIAHFTNYWQELDIDTDYSVTSDEAIEAAQMVASSDFPDGLRARIERADEINTELSIERPIRSLDWSKPVRGEYELIWSVRFIDSEGGYIRVQISAHSNEYVGMTATR